MRSSTGGSALDEPTGDTVADERALLEALRRRRADPLARTTVHLARAAARHGVDGLLGDGDPAWARWVDAVRFRSLVLGAFSVELSACLGAAGVRHVVLKGAVVAATAWPRPELRPLTDVDLLVEPADARRAVAALAEAGLVRSVPIWEWQHATSLHAPGRGGHVDLHHATGVDAALRVETAELLDRAVTIRTEAGLLPSLAPDDALCLVATHAARHLLDRLAWLIDVRGLAARAADQPERFAARARALGVAVPTAFALDAAARWLDDPASAKLVRASGVPEARLAVLRRVRDAGRTAAPRRRRAAELAARLLLVERPAELPDWFVRKWKRRRAERRQG